MLQRRQLPVTYENEMHCQTTESSLGFQPLPYQPSSNENEKNQRWLDSVNPIRHFHVKRCLFAWACQKRLEFRAQLRIRNLIFRDAELLQVINIVKCRLQIEQCYRKSENCLFVVLSLYLYGMLAKLFFKL